MNSTAKNTQTIVVDNIPPGGVIMWTKPEIPSGWAICDGTNGIPDLRHKFVRGALNAEELSHLGGQDQIQLGPEHLPKHSHGVTDPGHNHSLSINLENPEKTPKGKGNKDNLDSTIHSKNPHTMGSISKSKTGIKIEPEGSPKIPLIDNRPEFYSLYYIMKL